MCRTTPGIGRYDSVAFRVYPTRESRHLYPQTFYKFLTISGRPWYGQNLNKIYTKSTQSRHWNRFNEKCLFVYYELCFRTKYQPSPLLSFLKIHVIACNRYHCRQNEDTLPVADPEGPLPGRNQIGAKRRKGCGKGITLLQVGVRGPPPGKFLKNGC